MSAERGAEEERQTQTELRNEKAKAVLAQIEKNSRNEVEQAAQDAQGRASELANRRAQDLEEHARPALARKRNAQRGREQESFLRENQAKTLKEQRELEDAEKTSLVGAKMRPQYHRQGEDSGGDSTDPLLSHTYESKELELRLNGIESIGQSWARFATPKQLEFGPRDRVRPFCECPEDGWIIPVFKDATGVRFAPVPPPLDWYEEAEPAYDDSVYSDAVSLWALLSLDDLQLFKDPSVALTRFLGRNRPIFDDQYYNNPTEVAWRIFDETSNGDRLFDSLLENGILDPDRFYENYHVYGESIHSIPAHLDVPEKNTFEENPAGLHKADPRKFWTGELGCADVEVLRWVVQRLILKGFQAGREFERNLRREESKMDMGGHELLRKKGDQVNRHGVMIEAAIRKLCQSGIPLEDIRPKALEKFILEDCQNAEWRSLLLEVQCEARQKSVAKGKKGKGNENPGINCLKNGLSSYRKKVGKKEGEGVQKQKSKPKNSARKKGRRKKSEGVAKQNSPEKP